MPQCPCLSSCLFFNNKMANMPLAAEKMKARFCQSDNSECARYLVFAKLGRDKVPSDLFPRDVDLANKLISKR